MIDILRAPFHVSMQRSKEMAIRNSHNEHEAIANVASEDDERTSHERRPTVRSSWFISSICNKPSAVAAIVREAHSVARSSHIVAYDFGNVGVVCLSKLREWTQHLGFASGCVMNTESIDDQQSIHCI